MAPFLFSNSSTYAWRKCKRDFYLRYLWGGKGITGTSVEEDLLFGGVVHECMPAVWEGLYTGELRRSDRQHMEERFIADAEWEKVVSPEGRVAKAAEWGRLFEGMILAYERVMLPSLKAQFTMHRAEGDAVKWVSPYGVKRVGLMAKPDTLLAPRMDLDPDILYPFPTQGLGYMEFKTVKDPGARWQASFKRNPQLWTGAITVRAMTGQDIQWFTVCGLVKGVTVADEFLGSRRSHPWCWAYRCPAGAGSGRPSKADEGAFMLPDGSKWRYNHSNAKGWERASTDDFPGGVEAWIAALPLEVLREYVVMLPPVIVDWDLAEEWLESQRPMIDAAVEWRGAAGRDNNLRNRLFPRELAECEGWRGPCVYAKLCHNVEVGADPLAHGYKIRESHHQLEIDLEKVRE